ncbi:MAG: hypothetical protein ACYDEQ_09280 [Desulfocucumaceae bacterium]
MTRSGPKSKFTEAQIRTVTEAQKIVGTRALARVSGIHRATIHKWKNMEEKGTLDSFIAEKCPESGDQPVNEPTLEVTELSEMRQQNRALFVEQAMALALKILQKMESKLDQAAYKDLSVSFGILLDKILLMTGHATSRTETVHTVDREDLLRAAQEVSERVKVLPKNSKVNSQ